MTTDAELHERVRAVEDPALGTDVVSLGLVEECLVTDDGVAEMDVVRAAPGAPDEAALEERLREAAADLGLEPSLRVRRPDGETASPVPDVRHVVPIASGKGGVGKTTVATNLATALAAAGADVGLLDADVYGPNVADSMGVEAEPGVSVAGEVVPPTVDGVRLMSASFLTEDEQDPALLRGPMVGQFLTELLGRVRWGELDYLFVDLPPGTGDEQLTLLQTVPVTGAVVVTTPTDLSLADVRKCVRMFVDRDTPVLGVVENKTSFRCPNCEEEHDLYGRGAGADLAAEFGVPLLAQLPMDPAVRASSDVDQPVTVLREGAAAVQFEALTDAVANRVGAVGRAQFAGIDLTDVGLLAEKQSADGDCAAASACSESADDPHGDGRRRADADADADADH